MTAVLVSFICGVALGSLATAVLFRLRERAEFGQARKRAAAEMELLLRFAATASTPNGDLVLDFLTDLTVGMAQQLAGRDHKRLYLNGLTTISDETAHALTNYEQAVVVKDIDGDAPDTHVGLVDDEDGVLEGRLPTLSSGAAQACMLDEDELDDAYFFAPQPEATETPKQNTSVLHLDGLIKLSAKAAHALAMYRGDLSLNGLTAVSSEVAKALAQHRAALRQDGEIWDAATNDQKPRGCLSLNGLETLGDSAARALAHYGGDLCLDGLAALSEESARALASHRGRLSLNGLTTVSADVAAALAQHQQDVILDGLATLSPDVARAFARHQGDLRLDGVLRLSDDAVHELVRCTRTNALFLRSLTLVSNEALTLLQSDHHIKLPAF